MMEKIGIGKCLSELPEGYADKIVGTSGASGVLATSDSIVNAGGCGKLALGSLSVGKWYRIASSNTGNSISTAQINIGKQYNTSVPSSQLFYVSACGYSTDQIVACLANSGKSIGKARILYKNSITEGVFLDIYISTPGNNNFTIAYSGNIGFIFQIAVEISETPDAGYSVKEFTF